MKNNIQTAVAALLDSVVRTARCGVMLAMFGIVVSLPPAIAQDFIPPQELDGSRSTQPQEVGDGGQSLSTSDELSQLTRTADSQGQQVFDILVQELTNMIPYKLLPDSEAKKSIENAVTAFQIQEFNRASEILATISEKNPNFPPADLLRATLSYAVQDAENGQALLERAAVEHPEYPGIYSAFGRLALNQGRITDSLALFEKCSRIVESSELDKEARDYFEQQCLDGLIDVAMRQRRFDDARQYLQRQIRILPDSVKVLMSFAELEFQQGNIETSQEYLKTIKQKFPNARAPETILATWFDQQGNREEAGQWIKRAAEKHPNDVQVQLEYASYLVNIENFPLASSVISEAEKMGNESTFSRNLKARIAFCNQSYGVAEAHYKALAEAQPNSFDAVNMYALALIESNDPQKRTLAREIATRSFRSLPDNVIAMAALGYIHLRLGDLEQAKTLLGRVIVSLGSSPEIDFFIASYFEAVGEKAEAEKLIKSILEREGPFLYRKPARQMLERLQTGDSLPNPDN